MISRMVFKDAVHTFKGLTPELSVGIVSLVMLSCALFTISTYLISSSEDVFSLGTSVFVKGHVHKLLTYSFHHKTKIQILISAGVLVLLCSSIEKSVGTVRFFFLFLLLSTTTGVWYAILLLLDDSLQSQVDGFVPVSLAFVGVTTMHSRMTKAFLFGVSVPTLALPWLFLMIVTLLVPDTAFLCNVVAILTGWFYGRGWFSVLDMSQERASILDKKMPFRLLRNCGVLYVPASLEERRKLQSRITPTPGSYPVQAYAPVSSPSNIQATETTAKMMYEGWSHSSYASPGPPSAQHGHSHGHSLAQSFGLSHPHSHEHSHGHSCNHSHSHGQGHQGHDPSPRWGYDAPNSHSQHSHLSPATNGFDVRPLGDALPPAVSAARPSESTSVLVDLGAPAGSSM